MRVTAILTVRPGAEAAFRDFEARAAVVMARHGGRVERTTRLTATGDSPVDSGDAGFREVHLVFFPDEAAFAAYRADPALAELAALRASCIEATVIETGSREAFFPSPDPDDAEHDC